MPSLQPPDEGQHVCAADPQEEALVADAEPSNAAFDDVYLRYAPLLRHLALGRFSIPREDVDSLVHDVFATFLTDPTNIRSVRPYLVGGICNASRQYWRRRDREDAFCESAEDLVDKRTLDQVSMRLDVARALSRVGKRCREALRRYYLDGESTPTIAAFLETTPNNVLYLLHVCRKRARAALDRATRCT